MSFGQQITYPLGMAGDTRIDTGKKRQRGTHQYSPSGDCGGRDKSRQLGKGHSHIRNMGVIEGGDTKRVVRALT